MRAFSTPFDAHSTVVGGILYMTGRISRASRALIAIVLILLFGFAALADAIDVRLNTSARVYQSLSASARSVKAPKGLRVSLKAYANGWGKVTYKGRTGYVKLKYLDRVDPLKAYATKSTTVYRDATGTDKLTAIPTGAQVSVLGVVGGYLRVTNGSGKWRGYIKAGMLSSSKPSSGKSNRGSRSSIPESLRATAEGASRSRVEMAVFVAQSLIGADYSDNPNPPASFDCAHYTRYCYAKAGGKINGSSKTQGYDGDFPKIASVSDLKRGDLVCFNTVEDNDLSDHVGIYLGSGYFLHSSSVAKQVIVSQLTSGYYNRVFSWGRRILDK